MKFNAKQSRLVPAWGDGFEADGWSDLISVNRWEYCSSDEFIRVFPQLIPRAGNVPDCILQHLEERVAVLAWHAHRRRPAVAQDTLSSMTADRMEALGRAKERYWYPSARNRGRSPADIGLPGADEERAALAFLDRLLSDLRAGSHRSFDRDMAARLAFWSGVHPVYLWPEAVLSHQLFTAVGWLGHCARGRDALLPGDIAEYLLEVVVSRANGAAEVTDDILAAYVRTPAVALRLRRAAGRRGAGYRSVFRLRAPTGGWLATFAANRKGIR